MKNLKELFRLGGKKKDSKLRFNSKGSSMLATLLSVMAGVVLIAIVAFLVQISNKVNDINTGKVADGRLSGNVATYNDPAPTFVHYVKAPGFVGNLKGNADTATALAVDPSDCYASGTFATAIDRMGNLSCSADGSEIINVNAITLDAHDAAFFQNASNLTSGTVSNARLSSDVTLMGNTFNGANQLVEITGTGALPVLDGSNLFSLNASAVSSGTLADARLTANVTKYNDASPTFTNNVTAPTFNGNLNGNALTATALAADPADCAIGSYANAINSTGDLTCSNDGSSLVNIDASNITSGTLNDARLSGNVTVQGNTFNGANQLVQLDGAGNLPALDGSALTNLTGANVTGTVANATTAVNFTGNLAGDVTGTQGATVVANVNDSALSGNVVLLDGSHGLDFTGAGTITADAFQGDGSALTNLTGANVTGTVANAQTAVDFTGNLVGDVTGTQGATVVSNVNDSALSANVTLQGNTFNGVSQLVQLDGTGALPVLDGSNLTNLTGANVVGSVATADALTVDPADCAGGDFAVAIAANGDLTCNNDGSGLANLNASSITSGTLGDARLSTNVALLDGANGLDFTGSGALSADAFVGDGSGLTNITGANVVGSVATADALTADPADCASDRYAVAIAANGDLTCATITDASLSANVTLAGNTFNGISQLVQLDGTGALPALDGSALTNLTGANVTGTVANAQTAVDFTGNLVGDVTGTQGATVVSNVNDSALSANVTLKGNVFNGPNGLVMLDGAGALPALDGSQLTGITVATAAALTNDPVDCPAGQYAQLIAANGDLTCNNDGSQLANINGGNITAGTINDARLSGNVTLGGNNFNLANGLVQLDGTGALPALDGSQLTGITTTNFSGNLAGDVTGTQGATVVSNVNDSALSANVALLDGTNGLDFSGGGALTADSFVGDGSGLTNLTGANVTGTVANANTANTATTADSFTVNPADCTVGEYAQAIAANGDFTCNNDASALVNINAANISAGTLNDARLSANVTLAGNIFNGANQLVQLDGTGALPALDGANLTNLTGANVTGTVANANTANTASTAIALSVNPADCAAGAYANAINATGDLSCSNDGSQLSNLNAAKITSGTVNDLRLSANVTLGGNTFNGANQLVQLNGSGAFTSIDAGNLTNLSGASVQGNISGNASNVTGVVGDANVANNLTINGGTIDNTVIGGTTRASGNFTTINTNGLATLSSLSVTNNASVGGTLTVTGVATLNGATTINNTLNVTGTTTLGTVNISGTTTHTGTTSFQNTVTATSGVNFSGATFARMPVTAANLVDGVTSCAAAGSGAITFSSTNGSFFGCDGAVWQKLDN